MAKATIVHITMTNERGTVVSPSDGKFFIIKSIRQPGVLDIEATSTLDNLTISEFAEIVVGCFDSHSTFSGIGWINFTFDDVTVYINGAEATKHPIEYIVNKWNQACMDKIEKETAEKFPKYFTVKKFDNGVLELEPSTFATLYQIAASVAGCFSSCSAFTKVYQVNFTFNNKKISVEKEENPTPQMICKKWYDAPYEE